MFYSIMKRKSVICLLILLNISLAHAQKQFKNGISLAIGSEYLPEKDQHLITELTFTSKPNLGIQVGFERRIGSIISVDLGSSILIGRTKNQATIGTQDDPEGIAGFITNTIQRFDIRLNIMFWLIEQRKFAFTPSIGVAYGQTFALKLKIEDLQGNEIIPPQKENIENSYLNATLGLTNRFELTRFRSERKGTYGVLHLLVTPTLIYNLHTSAEIPVWLEHEEATFGAGLWLGLQYSF